jgi:WD40 repeat protein
MMAKNAADRPASMTDVVRLLEACRAPSIAAEAARLDKTVAQFVNLKRAAPLETIPDSSNFKHREPPETSREGDLKLEPVARHDRKKNRPIGPAAVSEPALPTRRILSPQARQPGPSPMMAAFALGSLALLASGGVGIWLLARFPAKAPRDSVRAKLPERSSSGSPSVVANSSTGSPIRQGTVRQPATFDVATLCEYAAVPWNAVAVTADGHRALLGGPVQYPRYLNVDNGDAVHPYFNWHSATISDVAITPDGRWAAIGTYRVGKNAHLNESGGTLRFWNMKSGEMLFPMQQPYPGHVTAVAISADGDRGLSAGENGELTLWNLKTGESTSLPQQEGNVLAHAMAFFPDGSHAATAGRDKRVHLWDLNTRREQAAWTGHDARITGLAISADARRIVTGSNDGKVLLWDVGQGEILKRFEMPPNDTGPHVAFDSEGHIVAAGHGMSGTPAKPGNLLVWDVNTQAVLRRDERPFARHLALATLPGGRLLTGDDYAVRIWTPRPPQAAPSEAPGTTSRQEAPVDLLALIDHEPHKSWGEWMKMRSSGLRSPDAPYARLQVPYEPPAEYRIDMKVELVGKESSQPLAVGLIVGGRKTVIGIDKVAPEGRGDRSVQPNTRYTGIGDYDGVSLPFGPHRHHGQLMFPSRPVQLSVTVRPESIRLTCDGSWVFDWNGDPRGLIPHVQWRRFGSKSLFLSTNSAVLIHEMTLIPLAAARP